MGGGPPEATAEVHPWGHSSVCVSRGARHAAAAPAGTRACAWFRCLPLCERWPRHRASSPQSAPTRSVATRSAPAANRAFAQLKAENYGSAIADAGEALKLDGGFVKAFYRRGSAHLALGKHKDARVDFRAVVKLKPADKDARAKLDECEKAIRRKAFEEVRAGAETDGGGATEGGSQRHSATRGGSSLCCWQPHASHRSSPAATPLRAAPAGYRDGVV